MGVAPYSKTMRDGAMPCAANRALNASRVSRSRKASRNFSRRTEPSTARKAPAHNSIVAEEIL